MNREINYPFIAIPVNFVYMMDGDCLKLMTILLQKYSYWSAHNKLQDGYFTKSITELAEELNLKNRKDVRLIIEALFRAEMFDVVVIPQKRNTAKFKLNWVKIEEIANMSMQEVKEFEDMIEKLPRHETPTYVTNSGTNMGTKVGTNCTTTINNKENINNKNNIYNINNILKEKENINIINNINIKEKESEVEVKVEDMEIKKEIKREIVEEIVSPANNGVNILSSILLDWNGESLEDKNNITPTPKKSSEELERMMEEVIATACGRDDELANFKMWVKLNKNDLNSAGLMGRAEEVFEILKNTSNKAILNPQTNQVEQVPTSKDNAVKTPKNTSYERCRKRTPSLPKIEVVDGQEYVCLGCGERIPVREGREEGIEIIDMLYEMEMANAC